MSWLVSAGKGTDTTEIHKGSQHILELVDGLTCSTHALCRQGNGHHRDSQGQPAHSRAG